MKHRLTAKIFIVGLLSLSHLACANQEENQRDFLTESILLTPFSAVVSHKNVTRLASNPNEGDLYIFNVEVIEPISGEAHKELSYRMFVESGEDVILNEAPVIISLCESNGDYYWPGVGAEFPATTALVKAAHQAAKAKLKPDGIDNSESHCD
ncbi:hypothetical protein DU002_08430 [Corallincola holothuriorum]|uniref:Lipoprotein n=1 Tax=Corallincola holothuriorum TaxID=2282215 RepID=A0A368NLX2_9GAMM|nr:hypothetical protein [Corallincola holothuriorum]RCU50439.1 hypothetical protein DU002_08430 [Corallincola holothuriorum]